MHEVCIINISQLQIKNNIIFIFIKNKLGKLVELGDNGIVGIIRF